MSSLAFDFGEATKLWRHVPVEYPPARELADRHYPNEKRRRASRERGDEGNVVLAAGWRFLLWHEGAPAHRKALGVAGWGVVRNRFRAPGWTEGKWFFRNSFFRNETTTLSSDLIRAATEETYALWLRRYKALPPERLITEVDIVATSKRRSKRHPPGICYLKAGWEHLHDLDPGHGRPARAVFGAPLPGTLS